MREARSLGVIVVLLVGMLSAHAQTQTTGAISGIVQDSTGAVLPGVEVKAGQAGTGETRTTVTNETGAYILPLLSPGKYTVNFALPGFQTLISRDVVVNATEKVTLNGRLQVGDLNTSIDVAATAELIQAQTTTLGRVIDERLTTSLPLPTKNYTQLLTLSTGTAAAISDTAQLGRGSINISANGAPTDSNTFLLDGVDANNIHTNQASNNNLGSNGVPVPSTEMLREFKVQSGQYDAQYGRNGGASINVVTKSGTNDIHFVLFEYFRNDVLNANNFFFNSTGTHRPILRQNQFGGTVGGPIRHDKTFFFIGYQGTRQINGASLSNSSTSLVLPPIPEVRTRETLGQVFAGQSGRNGGTAIAPDGSNINPVALAFLNRRWPDGQYVIPTPQRTGPGVNFTASTPARYTENQITVNIDHELSTNHKMSLRFFGANVPQILAYGQNLGLPGFTTYNDFKNRNASITDTYTISAKTVNEARVGYSRPAGQSSATQSVNAADVGLNRYNLDRFPQIPNITVSGVIAIGHNANTDQATIPNTFVYQDTLSLTRGSHFVRAGGEARRMQDNYFNHYEFQGELSFLSFPDFLLGMPGGPAGNGTAFSNIQSVTLNSGQDQRYMRSLDLAAFLQDDWKVSPKLTLNLGIRYEFIGLPHDRYGRNGNFELRRFVPPPPGGQTSTGFVEPQNTLWKVPGLPLVNDYLVDHNGNKNLAPRIGLALRPLGSKPLVIRAGYGIFYDRTSNNIILQAKGPFLSRFLLSGTSVDYASFQNPFPVLPRPEEHPVVPLVYGPPYNTVRRLYADIPLDPELKIPYLQHYSFNIQYELVHDLLLEAGYVGSKGTKLRSNRTLSQPLLASPEQPVNGVTTNTVANVQDRVPLIGFSPTSATEIQSQADSHYNSLQVSLTKRFSRGLQFLGSYTWAKSLDNTTISGDTWDYRQNRGPSSFDRQQRFVFSYVYEIPAWGFRFNDSLFGRLFFKGWQISGVTTAQSGTPITITDSTGAAFFGATSSRANFAAGATAETATLTGNVRSRLNRYFNTAAFARAGNFWGTAGLGILRGPGQTNSDIALTKLFRMAESRSFEWRTEVFNVLNHANFANPASNITSSTFGTITSTVGNARLIQFGARIVY